MSHVPIIIGHRGVPGERLEQGADYIEPDVVSTRDGVLVVRHENEIGATTDVADRPEFADRKASRIVDGASHTGWFTEDFTLAELKTLRVRERLTALRPQNTLLDDTEQILTFEEVLDIAEQGSAGRAEPVGVYVETKHPTHFARIGLDLNDLLIADLERRGANHARSKVIIQSMETGNLRQLRDRTPLPLIQLMTPRGAPQDLVDAGDRRTYSDLSTPGGLVDIATYADGIGPNKDQVIARDRSGRLAGETDLVRDAHDAGLLVHVWTMRNENNYLPAELRAGADKAGHGDAVAEYLAFFDAGVDGVFSDFTQTAVGARSLWWERRAPAATRSAEGPEPGLG